jgi:hypothetical protein
MFVKLGSSATLWRRSIGEFYIQEVHVVKCVRGELLEIPNPQGWSTGH